MSERQEEQRRGRQTPTLSAVLPYTQSLGSEAVELYDRSGRKAQEWQALMMEDIMAVNADGLWLHMKFGWSIPRRNGKSELLIMRSMWDLLHGRRVLYTAHRESTSANAWEKLLRLLSKAGYAEGEDYKSYKSAGRRSIEWLLDDSEAVINFRTRTTAGGLGEGYDTLIIDEAQEYTADQETTLKYVVTDSKNPQTLLCGTPPTVVSSGDVFLKLRRSILTGKEEDAGWAEWSVPRLTNAHDPELWYETNPSLGYILSERTIRSELGDPKANQVDDNIQRLGLWLAYSQKAAITEKEWMAYRAERPQLAQPVRVWCGVKYGVRTETVSLACAAKTADGKVFVEALDCRNVRDGTAWIIAFLRSRCVKTVVIDGKAGAPVLTAAMADAGVKLETILPRVDQVTEANSVFEANLFAGLICHAAQPSLVQAVANCEHRLLSRGGFGYASLNEQIDATLVEAVSLAHWAAARAKKRQAQIVGY